MRQWVIMGWVLGLVLSACQPSPAADKTVVVFAAASLAEAFEALGTAFEQTHAGVTVRLQFGGSSQLAAQVNEGAQADIFASANQQQVMTIEDLWVDAPIPFASNRLVIITPATNPAEITTLADLARPAVKIVTAVEGVPIRLYTDTLMATLSDTEGYGAAYVASFYANIVSAETNVRQATLKIALGEADAAIVYATDVTPDIQDDVRQIALPANLAPIPVYYIVQLAEDDLTQDFIAFVMSAEGQAILQKWGFSPAP